MAFKALSNEGIQAQYPQGLELEGVHIFFRHGARTPTSPLMTELGLPVYWPLCSDTRTMLASVRTAVKTGSHERVLPWKRFLEKIHKDDGPEVTPGNFNLCNHGVLTDSGRDSMVQLGRDLRDHYITHLGLLPPVLYNQSRVYIRSSPFPRALESLQHVIWGMLPPEARAPDFGPVRIAQRGERDETLLPNEDFCARFIELCKSYTRRTSERWDNSKEMEYINDLIGKHMAKPITLAGTPKIHAIYDGITSTAATEDIRLPPAFYDQKLKKIIDELAYEEEFGGYSENNELRKVGIGAMMGDVVQRMVSQVEHNASPSAKSTPNTASKDEVQIGGGDTKLWLHASHDSTVAAVMASLGADKTPEGELRWPIYGSVLAVELFKDTDAKPGPTSSDKSWSSLLPFNSDSKPIGRTPSSQLTVAQKARFEKYFVRLRYNNRSLTIPGCKAAGKNWNDNDTFCTLEAFKEIVDQFTPRDWRQSCMQNLGKDLPETVQPAGFNV